MTHPRALRLRITGMQRRTAPRYRVTQCLHPGRSVQVPVHQIAAIVSIWLAELGVDSPLVEDLAKAVHTGDWPTARAMGELLSVEVTTAA
jgi:hypothetical protein